MNPWHDLAAYWAWAGSNIGAMPACGLIAAGFAFILRDRLGRALRGWYRRHLGHSAELAEIREIAERAHRIGADLYRHHAGRDHPDAPGGEGS